MTEMVDAGRGSWVLKFHDLMRYMVREILVVSSAYDAFILEEDGRLDERLVTAYSELNLSSIPRITNCTTAAEAISLLDAHRFDLVLTVVRVADADAGEVSRRIKKAHPDLPVILLAFDEADLDLLPGPESLDAIDRVFLWNGDAQILIAAIKLIEDARNVDADTASAGVQVIIVVEDNLRRYSAFLGMLYSELMIQARSLIAEGLNTPHRVMRMRARPKILLAETYEEAVDYYRRYRDSLMAVISDVRFPRDGVEDPEAGVDLARKIRESNPDLPMMLQSAEPEFESQALDLSAAYANKNSPSLLEQIRFFLKEGLGFGPFVFRLPDRTEVGRAEDLYELEQVLATVSGESLAFHAGRHHFSMWLNARGKFELARKVRPRTLENLGGVEPLRQFLIQAIREDLTQEQEGVLADFSPSKLDSRKLLMRIGQGSIGGKGRGIAFVNAMLVRARPALPASLEVRIPRTIAVGTDEFDRFMEENAISRDVLQVSSADEITSRFLEGELHADLVTDLETGFRHLSGPLAIRSSSLLEDSRYQPFAGIYDTVMLPNNHPDARVRFRELRQAVKAVYASTYSRQAQAYFAGTPHSAEEEKMAVVIQELVGNSYGHRFYPHVSGVSQSYNYYPVGPQKAEDGVALLALGLGHAVVSGGMCLRVSPRMPSVLPQFASPRDMLRLTQNEFWALDLSRDVVDFRAPSESSLVLCQLKDATEDGTLRLVGSVYNPSDDIVRDTFNLDGPPVVTFANLLKWREVPFTEALSELLSTFREAMGSEVEIEFALNLSESDSNKPCLYVLQVRPMAALAVASEEDLAVDHPDERVLVRSQRCLGHGQAQAADLVYVGRIPMDAPSTRSAAAHLGAVTADLQKEGRPYILVGPGRWGSADPNLGIPVDWTQIRGVQTLVETGVDGRHIEPSQGTHFLQNITFLRIGYLTVNGRAGEWFDRDWLEGLTPLRTEGPVRHYRFESPASVRIDSRRGMAVILKPKG